jgi:hypothetical protein
MIYEIFIALLKVGLPVGLASYGLVWWALKKNYIAHVDNIKSLEQEVKKRTRDKKLKKEGDLFHRKWLAFGGGFYGVVGLLTYALVEIAEVRDFILQFGGIVELIKSLSFDLIINLFVGAIKNFVVAIAWPVYWLDEIQSEYIWVWFVVAYGAYWAGSRLALGKAGVENSFNG